MPASLAGLFLRLLSRRAGHDAFSHRGLKESRIMGRVIFYAARYTSSTARAG
jgi:hypothetical protein